MSPLTREEQEILARMKKESAPLLEQLPRPTDGKGMPAKLSDFAPGLDDRGNPFPVQSVAPAPRKS